MSGCALSVVIPCYRSASTLTELVARLLPVLDALGGESEVICVEDGSPDDEATWRCLVALQEAHPRRLRAIQLMRNYGQHNALMCGFRHVRGRVIVTMDDDLQHPPEEIPKLIKALESRDLDLVYGVYGDKKHSGWRNAGSGLIRAFYRITFKNDVDVTAFRAARRELVRSILPYNLNFTYIDGLLAWNTRRIGEVRVEHRPRAEGRSGYNLSKLLALAFNLFTNFSLLPLQLVSAFGLLAAAGGILTAFYYVVLSLMHQIEVPGYASTIVAVLILGGIQLLSLGIMGEYLGRLHMNVNRKPQYNERQVLGAAERGRPADPEDVPGAGEDLCPAPGCALPRSPLC